jgi:hypothetical protein
MYATARRKGWFTAVVPVALLTLARPAGAQTRPADAQTPRREANTWGWRDRQPDQTQVTRRERQAGIAPSPAQRKATARELQRIDRELTHGDGPRLSAPEAPARAP